MLFLNMRIIPKENITMNILVVDDEQTILTGVEEYLKEYGYNVFTAGNGVEAINIFNDIEIVSTKDGKEINFSRSHDARKKWL